MSGIEDLFKQFDWSQLAIFVLFALPGFISMQVWGLIFPSSERTFMDKLPEAVGFGVLNAAVVGPFVVLIAPRDPWLLYGTLIAALTVLPAIWPFLLKWLLQALHRRNIILNPTHNGWDAAFLRRERYFVFVHLKDGRRVGGFYGYSSFAGVYPASGHLYLEQLWSLDAAGRFVAAIPDSKGFIVRPEDYQFVELLRA